MVLAYSELLEVDRWGEVSTYADAIFVTYSSGWYGGGSSSTRVLSHADGGEDPGIFRRDGESFVWGGDFETTINGDDQLVDDEPLFADGLGLDSIDALVELRSRHDSDGRAGIISEGQTGTVTDPVEAGVFDPVAVKHEAIESATEAATMIARIDDVISADN